MHTARWGWLAIVLASGCSLYFHEGTHDAGGGGGGGDDVGGGGDDIDGGSIYPSSNPTIARCEDGQLFAIVETSTYEPTQPGHGAGTLIGTCAGVCQSAAVLCADQTCANAAATLCAAPASVGATCPLDGTACTGSGSLACPQATTCGASEPNAACTCDGTTYHCGEVVPVAATQASVVGKWAGTVTPPSFASAYQVSLWIYPDGTYWAENTDGGADNIAFYYGGDGPLPDRTLTLLSVSATAGASANIAIDFGGALVGNAPNTGALEALTVDATHLRFTFYASWFGCDQAFDFELTRR